MIPPRGPFMVSRKLAMKDDSNMMLKKCSIDKEWKKLETSPAWRLDNVRSKKEAILEAQRDKKKVHFASLMDICHFKNAELEPKFQKFQGRVDLRG